MKIGHGQAELWNKILSEFRTNPRDVCTCPTRGQGVWFYVWVEGRNLYVANSKKHMPSSKIKGRRRLDPDECTAIFNLYKRRCCGEAVSQEAIALTRNQAYWYGIFHAIEMDI